MSLDPNIIAPVVSGIGVIITAIYGYKSTKRSANKDEKVNDRQLLSKDEQEFRSTILQENKILRETVEELTSEVNLLKIENGKFKLRILELEGGHKVKTEVERETEEEAITGDEKVGVTVE